MKKDFFTSSRLQHSFGQFVYKSCGVRAQAGKIQAGARMSVLSDKLPRQLWAGQLNFYLNVLDEKVKLPHENASIGIVLCKEKNNTVVKFAVRSIDKAMGVATYRTTKEVPKEMEGILPDAADLARLL